MGMQLLETITVGSGGAASIEFTGIASGSQDVMCIASVRSNNSSVVSNTRVYFNGNTGGTYPVQYMTGNGSSVTSGSTSYSFAGRMNGAGSPSNTFTTLKIYVTNHWDYGTLHSSIKSTAEDTAQSSALLAFAGQNETTGGPLTSMKIQTSGGDTIVEHSTASLYAITAD
jgi:hypothetical protein|tara:strand:- start:164 stop:673 length:510 start_codon:yes stop_codon:yes gene_type:complete